MFVTSQTDAESSGERLHLAAELYRAAGAIFSNNRQTMSFRKGANFFEVRGPCAVEPREFLAREIFAIVRQAAGQRRFRRKLAAGRTAPQEKSHFDLLIWIGRADIPPAGEWAARAALHFHPVPSLCHRMPPRRLDCWAGAGKYTRVSACRLTTRLYVLR